LWERAISSSVEFAEANMVGAAAFTGQEEIREFALASATSSELANGQVFLLEFGVWEAESMRLWAAGAPSSAVLVGFDSFEGLPEAWPGTSMRAGTFSLRGNMPDVPENVILVKGWVENTLGEFLKNYEISAVKLIHMDLDLYAPSLFVLKTLKPHLASGTLILFDEYFGFPFWQFGEHRALHESGIVFEYVAFSTGERFPQVLVKVL